MNVITETHFGIDNVIEVKEHNEIIDILIDKVNNINSFLKSNQSLGLLTTPTNEDQEFDFSK